METKACIKCERMLTLDCFYKRKPAKPTHSTFYTGECKECRLSRTKEYWRTNIIRHRETVNRRYHTFRRFARYGISVEIYDEILEKQNGKCALCKTESPGGKGKWHIDHVGGTTRGAYNQCKASAVRGLLCHRCNVSLGHYEKLLKRIGQINIMRYLKE